MRLGLDAAMAVLNKYCGRAAVAVEPVKESASCSTYCESYNNITSTCKMDFTKQDTVLDLANIREALIRMEETVVFNLIERAQFFQSPSVYIPNALNLPDFDGSFLDWFLREVENTQGWYFL